jgi:hypothetical protein
MLIYRYYVYDHHDASSLSHSPRRRHGLETQCLKPMYGNMTTALDGGGIGSPHHDNDNDNDRTGITTKKGFETRTRLEPQVCFFFYFFSIF